MDEPIRHHFITQFILRYFCFNNRGQAILVLPWVLRRAKAGYSYTCDGVGENENLFVS